MIRKNAPISDKTLKTILSLSLSQTEELLIKKNNKTKKVGGQTKPSKAK